MFECVWCLVLMCFAAVLLHDLPWLTEHSKCLWDFIKTAKQMKMTGCWPLFGKCVLWSESLSLLAWLKPIWQWGHITGDRWVGEDRPAFQHTHTHTHTSRTWPWEASIHLSRLWKFEQVTVCIFVCVFISLFTLNYVHYCQWINIKYLYQFNLLHILRFMLRFTKFSNWFLSSSALPRVEHSQLISFVFVYIYKCVRTFLHLGRHWHLGIYNVKPICKSLQILFWMMGIC